MVFTHAHHFANLSAEFVGNALTLVDVDADTFAKDQLHGGRMTQLYNDLHDEVNALVVWRHPVEMDRVMH